MLSEAEAPDLVAADTFQFSSEDKPRNFRGFSHSPSHFIQKNFAGFRDRPSVLMFDMRSASFKAPRLSAATTPSSRYRTPGDGRVPFRTRFVRMGLNPHPCGRPLIISSFTSIIRKFDHTPPDLSAPLGTRFAFANFIRDVRWPRLIRGHCFGSSSLMFVPGLNLQWGMLMGWSA